MNGPQAMAGWICWHIAATVKQVQDCSCGLGPLMGVYFVGSHEQFLVVLIHLVLKYLWA